MAQQAKNPSHEYKDVSVHPEPKKKLGMTECICNPSTVDGIERRSLELTGQPI